MKLQPIVYVTDMDRATAWYTTLLGADPSVASPHWTSFSVGGANLALHHSQDPPTPGGVELSLVTEESLESVLGLVGSTDVIRDQPFGRSVVVVDPDGTKIQINEHDPDRYSA